MAKRLPTDNHPAGRADDDHDPSGAAPTTDEAVDVATVNEGNVSTLDRFTGITPGNVEHATAVEQSGQVPDSAALTEGEA